jgi:uncharacterized protein (DUF2252 family)
VTVRTVVGPSDHVRRDRVRRDVPERAALGRRARTRAPRRAVASFEPSADRASSIEILEHQARTRLPELLPIRYGRMAESRFAFFRGAAAVMAADIAGPVSTGLTVQLCGDAHLLNFGLFAAPDRRLVFSINDFDETLPGPFEWDLKRLAASLTIAARDRGFDPTDRAVIVADAVRTYREATHEFSVMRAMDVWYARLDLDEIKRRFRIDADRDEAQLFRRTVRSAVGKDSLRAIAKLTRLVDGELQFVTDPPILVRVHDLVDATTADRLVTAAGRLLRSYRATLSPERRVLADRFRCVDLARKVVGIGSVGTRTWVALLLGRDEDDPLVLQYKQAEASVLEPHLGASAYDNHGCRVVEGQRLMQAASDVLLGWQRNPGLDGTEHDYYVRQLWDKKGSVDLSAMTPRSLRLYGCMCAWTLARAHARSGDPVAIAAYLGRSDRFDRAMVGFAERYADQNERDHRALLDAIAHGVVPAVHGV